MKVILQSNIWVKSISIGVDKCREMVLLGKNVKLIGIVLFFLIFCAYGIFSFELGIASWYGGKFHGRLTASGEIFDTNDFTAAHKSLPFGTIVRVTNLDNGKSVVVRINDRGPFVKGRVIDLSRAAAKAIGMLGSGIARVRIDIIRMGDNKRVKPRSKPTVSYNNYGTEKKDNANKIYVLQVGAFKIEANALNMQGRLEKVGFKTSLVYMDSGIIRVFVIDISGRELEKTLKILKRLMIGTPLVREEIVKK